MPGSFNEMFFDDESGSVHSDLVRPLSSVITPMSMPKIDCARCEEGDNQTDIDLFPSLHSSIKDDSTSTSAVPRIKPTPVIRTEIKQGKLEGPKSSRR